MLNDFSFQIIFYNFDFFSLFFFFFFIIKNILKNLWLSICFILYNKIILYDSKFLHFLLKLFFK